MARTHPPVLPLAAALALGSLAAGWSAAAAAPPAGVTLAGAGGNVVRLQVAVPPPVYQPVGPAGSGMTALLLPGYGSDAACGSPAVPSATVLVAVPPLGEVRVSADGSEAESRDGLLLAPEPNVPRTDRTETPRYDRSPAAYAQPGAPPRRGAPPHRVGGIGHHRGARRARNPPP